MTAPILSPASQAPTALAAQAAPAVPAAGSDKAQVQEAARKFEGMLMSMIFQEMRKTVQPSGLFGGGEDGSKRTYEYLLDQAVAEHAMARGGGWGLADRLAKSWEKGRTDAQ